MGYLDNTTVTVDAILTKKGRELLSKGATNFKITQFALADDEIDYTLWNAAHSLGTNYYGEAIENLPLIEASPDETQNMRYKLITLPKTVVRIPVINLGATAVQLTLTGQTIVVSPSTSPAGGNSSLGYTAILHNSDAATIGAKTPVQAGVAPTVPTFLSDSEMRQSVAAVGFEFNVTGKPQPLQDLVTQITVIGNETGGQATLTLTVKKQITAYTTSLTGD